MAMLAADEKPVLEALSYCCWTGVSVRHGRRRHDEPPLPATTKWSCDGS